MQFVWNDFKQLLPQLTFFFLSVTNTTMSSVAQDRNLGVIPEFSISNPHHSQFTLALKCLKKKKNLYLTS